MKHTLHPLALYWASFNRFELRLPGEAVNDIARPGDNDEAVRAWAGKIKNEWPDRCTPDAIREELREYGAWDAEELSDDAANWERLIWTAAHNIAEGEPDCSASVDEAKTLRFPDGRWSITHCWGALVVGKIWEIRFGRRYLGYAPTRKAARETLRAVRLHVLRDAGSLRPILDVAREYLDATP